MLVEINRCLANGPCALVDCNRQVDMIMDASGRRHIGLSLGQ